MKAIIAIIAIMLLAIGMVSAADQDWFLGCEKL